MVVYNVSKIAITYRKRLIQAGGSFNFTDLQAIPARDQILVDQKMLAFGSLPAWYTAQNVRPVKPKPSVTKAPTHNEALTSIAAPKSVADKASSSSRKS